VRAVLSSIKAKIALVVVAGIVSAVLLVTLTSAWREMSRRTAGKNAELAAIGEALASTIASPVARGDIASVGRALSAIRRMPTIRYVRALDNQNNVLVQFGVGIVLGGQEDAYAPLMPGSFAPLWRRQQAFTVPIVSSGARVGRLEIVADVSDLQAAFWSGINSALLSAFMAAMIGLMVSSRLQPLVTGPIAGLTAAMHEVRASHDFERVVPRRSNDEAGELVDAFNDLLAHIRRRDELLAQHRASLENEVLTRTAELAEATQAAEAANAAKSEFLAAMSHEIRTPLHGMLAMSEMLLASDLPGKQRERAQVIERSGRSLLAIVNDILDFSKIEAGRMEIESIPVSPVSIADEVVQLFAARARDAELALDVRCEEGVPAWIKGDPVRLTQILSNLVSNAIKFTRTGGVVLKLEVASNPGYAAPHLRISVIDTGIGIPTEALERIFDAFSQADQSTTRKYGGTGIGLTITRRLATAMGGRIDVKSAIGRGSTFSLDLPIELAEPPSVEAGRAAPAERVSFEGLAVLAADDNAVNREVLEQALGHLGVAPVIVENGKAAVEAFKSRAFDLVLMDCSMPVLDGYAATRQIRAWECEQRLSPVPVIALTAFVIGKQASEWREAGMSDCLTKPFTVRGLTECLTRHATMSRVVAREAEANAADALQADHNASGSAVLDRNVLDGIVRMDKNGTLLARIVGLFESTVPSGIRTLEEAVARANAEDIAAAAHALKSMCLTIGAQRVALLAGSLEADAQSIAIGGAGDRVGIITTELECAIVALHRLLADPAGSKAIPDGGIAAA
jgi:signal transduction histidine kinase/CheY-like chemotaxis protein/HPt (histidine-containing phosphotransfer) domain-containing protein